MTSAVAVVADPATIREYLSFYAERPGYLSVCSDTDKFVGRRFTTDEAGLGAATDYAVQLDKRKPKGIYVQVTTLREAPANGRGGEDLAHCMSYIWADGDFGTIGHKPGPDDLPHPADADDVLKVIREAVPLEPTVVSNSGGGVNPAYGITPYIITGDADRARIKKFTTDWQAIFAATAYKHGFTWDAEVGNLDRLTRLIGTVNGKEGLARPTWILGGGGEIYELEQLIAVAEQLAPEAHDVMAQASREKQARKAARTGHAVPTPRPAGPVRQHSGDGPLDVIADTMRFGDILGPAGFTFRGYHGDGREKWLRSAAGGDPSSEYSLLCNDHVAINWSERSDLPVGAQPSGAKLTIGRIYALINYGGDTSAASKDIMRAAAGKAAQGAAGSLPIMVLAEVKRRCMAPAAAVPPTPSFSDDEWNLEDPAEEEPEPSENGQRPGLLPDTFYDSRLELGKIRAAAHSRNRSRDVAFYAVLTRLSGMVSHHIRADTGVANLVSLNMFAAVVGPSGTGKSTGVSVGARLLPAPHELDFRDGLPIGSGEGIAEVFMDTVEEPTGEVRRGGEPIMKSVRRQVRHNVAFYVDEGATLTRLMRERSGSTLGETLRSAAVGQTLGQTNASKETTRYIPGGSYSMGLLVGFQPETAAPLFDETAEGTPQRFLWGTVVDPSIPDERVEWPGELTAYKQVIRATETTLITFDEVIANDLWREDLDRARGHAEEGDPLDAHKPLMLIKVSSLLAVLAGRLHVTVEDWALAGQVWDASCGTRDAIVSYSARQRAAEAEKRTTARIIEEVRVDQAKVDAEATRADKAVQRVARRLGVYVHAEGQMVKKKARGQVAGRDRKYMDDALAYAVLREWITEDARGYAPGPQYPS